MRKLGYETTVRYPDFTEPKNDILKELELFYKNPPRAGLPVLNPERNLTERTVWILQAYKSYMAMSNNKFRKSEEIKDAANWGSLEDIHNAVHGLVGGGGHVFLR